jgi:hypothetical protein
MVYMADISETSEHICQASMSISYKTAIFNYAKKPNKVCQMGNFEKRKWRTIKTTYCNGTA